MFVMQMPPFSSHGWMTMDWLFLKLLNVVFFLNVRLLEAFWHGLLMEVLSFLIHLKKSTKVGLSDGVGI